MEFLDLPSTRRRIFCSVPEYLRRILPLSPNASSSLDNAELKVGTSDKGGFDLTVNDLLTEGQSSISSARLRILFSCSIMALTVASAA